MCVGLRYQAGNGLTRLCHSAQAEMNSADLTRLGCQHTAGFARFDFGCFLIKAGQVAVELKQIDGQLFLKMGQVGLGGLVIAGQGNTISKCIF